MVKTYLLNLSRGEKRFWTSEELWLPVLLLLIVSIWLSSSVLLKTMDHEKSQLLYTANKGAAELNNAQQYLFNLVRLYQQNPSKEILQQQNLIFGDKILSKDAPNDRLIFNKLITDLGDDWLCHNMLAQKNTPTLSTDHDGNNNNLWMRVECQKGQNESQNGSRFFYEILLPLSSLFSSDLLADGENYLLLFHNDSNRDVNLNLYRPSRFTVASEKLAELNTSQAVIIDKEILNWEGYELQIALKDWPLLLRKQISFSAYAQPAIHLLLLAVFSFFILLLMFFQAKATMMQEVLRHDYTGEILDEAMAAAADGMMIFSCDARLMLVNQQANSWMKELDLHQGIHIDDFYQLIRRYAPTSQWPVLDTDKPFLDRQRLQLQLSNGLFLLLQSRYTNSGGVVIILTDITAEKRQEAELLELNRRNRQLAVAIESTMSGMVITDPKHPDNPIIFANTAFLQMTGYRLEEIMGKNCRFLQGEDSDQLAIGRLRQAVNRQQRCTAEMLNYRKDGSKFWNELTIAPVYDEQGTLDLFIGIQNDVTTRKLADSQALQAQKLDALGQLAGGIAHDFNNVLSIIDGFTRLSMKNLAPDHQSRDYLERVLKACGRATGFTRQLLAFGRKKLVGENVVELGYMLIENKVFLQPSLGETILLTLDLPQEKLYCRANGDLMGQVIINLAINARDAMPNGGKVEIGLKKIAADKLPDTIINPSYAEYAHLSVHDNGDGMDEDTVKKIFEPFFTTKAQGEGTGLGLAMVYGTVTQLGGHINVHSSLGHGTYFEIYLPLVEAPEITSSAAETSEKNLNGRTILVVEDEPDLLELLQTMLPDIGLKVISAGNAHEALTMQDEFDGKIDFLLTDMVMPDMNGAKLVELLKDVRPNMQAIFMTGYPSRAQLSNIIIPEHSNILSKPVNMNDLANLLIAKLQAA